MLKLAVVGTSRKENEQRLPVHPLHFDQIPAEIRPNIRFALKSTSPSSCPPMFNLTDVRF